MDRRQTANNEMLALPNVISTPGMAMLKLLHLLMKHGSECLLRNALIKLALFDFYSKRKS
jgi:hypothetical protein